MRTVDAHADDAAPALHFEDSLSPVRLLGVGVDAEPEAGPQRQRSLDVDGRQRLTVRIDRRHRAGHGAPAERKGQRGKALPRDWRSRLVDAGRVHRQLCA